MPTSDFNAPPAKYTISGGTVTLVTGEGVAGDITFIGRGGG